MSQFMSRVTLLTALIFSFATASYATPQSLILGVWQCSTIQDMGGAQLEIASSDNYLPGGKSLSVGRIVIKVNNKLIAGYEFQGSSSYTLDQDTLTGTVERLEVKNVLNPEFERMAKLSSQLKATVGQSASSEVVELSKDSFILEEENTQTLTACSRPQSA